MDTRAAAQYMTQLFGANQGFVAVAYKDKGESWQEAQFEWPKDKTKIVGWAKVHHDANVFICPALRQDPSTRKKGDGTALRWLWADVDMDKVPEEKRTDVEARIKQLGTLVVASGSGDNRHVYVRLDRDVTVSDHLRLNTGLRNYLYADNKQSDNSLLRLPGTTNWKTDKGSPVKRVSGVVRGKEVTPDELRKIRTFAQVKVVDTEVSNVSWKQLMPEGISRRVKAMVQMDSAEAIARYGSRHKAVWAITGELHKRGFDSDMVHTLMDQFPPALEKRDEEHGAYDVHKDVEKRLLWDRANEPQVMDDEAHEDAGEMFEELTAEQMEESIIAEGVERELLRRAIHRAANNAEALRGHTEPPPDTSQCLSDALRMPPSPVQWLIEGLCSATATVVITGQFKTGKTKLMLASLVSSLVDGTSFLGAYPVYVPEGGAVVGHWNLEMSALDLIDKYMRPVGYQNPHNVHLANWRGYSLNLLTIPGKRAAVEWLRQRNVGVWTIDSWTALCRMCGVDPNDGTEVGRLLGAIEEIKVESGVPVCFFLAHTSKAGANEDRPATRGASEVDDHVDTRWMLTVDKSDVRFIQAQGRDTQLTAMSLDFDEITGRSTIGAVSRQSAAADGAVQLIVKTLADMGPGRGLDESTLWAKVKEIKRIGKLKLVEYVTEAVDAGFVRIEKVSRAGGGKPMKMHYLVTDGPVENDRHRQATPREINFALIDERRSAMFRTNH